MVCKIRIIIALQAVGSGIRLDPALYMKLIRDIELRCGTAGHVHAVHLINHMMENVRVVR